MKFRLYVDEVGSGELNASATNDNARYLSLTGVVTSIELRKNRFQPELDALKSDFFGHSPERLVILHRREVMDRKGPFAVLHNPEVRAEFDRRFFDLLSSLPYRAITVTIDKRLHLEHYKVWRFDPYHYCMCCLVERFVRWLNDNEIVGNVVVEARNKNPDKKLKASYARIYEKGTEQVSANMVREHLTSSELKLHPKKDNIAGLQIADAIAHPSFRAMKHAREGVPRPQDFGGRVATMLEASKLRRSPYDRTTIDGYGRKWLPH